MYYLFIYDDNQQDCILHMKGETLSEFKTLTANLVNQGVGYQILQGEIVESVNGVVFGDGEDIWETVDEDDSFLDEQSDDEAFDEYYSNSNDWEPEENWIDEDRPY